MVRCMLMRKEDRGLKGSVLATYVGMDVVINQTSARESEGEARYLYLMSRPFPFL